jgi:hypothetical protein
MSKASAALLSGLLAIALSAPLHRLHAQYRYGISLGGASTVALIVERRWEHQGLELQVGTWAFRDLSLSITGKQYVGNASNDVQPFVGAGLWALMAFAEEGRGYGLIGRIPLGLDWSFSGPHAAALTIYLNRALALRRPDPEDQRPPRTTLIPLPEFSYRWMDR